MELYMNGTAIETVRAGGRHGGPLGRAPVTGSRWPTPRAVSDRPHHPGPRPFSIRSREDAGHFTRGGARQVFQQRAKEVNQ
jgi:hypothetical protein